VHVRSDKGNLTLQLPSAHAQFYYKLKQKYISFGSKDTTENQVLAMTAALAMDVDLTSGKFDPDDITKYQHPSKRLKDQYQPVSKNILSVVELYEVFLKHLRIGKTTLETTYSCYRNHLKKMYDTHLFTLHQQLEIKSWILNNVANINASTMLAMLHRMIEWCKREGYLPNDFISKFKHYANECRNTLKTIDTSRKPPRSTLHLTRREGIRAWSESERDAIISSFYTVRRRDSDIQPVDYLAYLIDFLFNTGTRHGEAFALTWGSVIDDFKKVNIDKSYSSNCRITKCTKTGKKRIVPLNERMQEILMKIKPDNATPEMLVFRTGTNKNFNSNGISKYWNPNYHCSVIGKMITEGKLTQYLDAYSTRRTFVSIQLNKGVPVNTVAMWVGDNPETILKYYGRPDDSAVPY